MPLAFFVIGTLFLVAAVRGKDKTDELFSTLKSDFTGPKNFFYWAIALFLIGAVGYYKPMKPVSTAFMTLVIVVLFFSNKGFPQEFMNQIGMTTANQDNSTFLSNPIAALSRISTELNAMGVSQQ